MGNEITEEYHELNLIVERILMKLRDTEVYVKLLLDKIGSLELENSELRRKLKRKMRKKKGDSENNDKREKSEN